MAINPSPNYRQWMREQFPMLNRSIDDGRSEDLHTLSDESIAATQSIVHGLDMDNRERFTYISMIHAALYHHKKRATELGIELPGNFGSTMNVVERSMIELASSIGVEHRFLSVFYLFYNPEIPNLQGKFAQFRPSEYETAFLRVNKEGTLQYKLAAQALFDAFDLLQRGLASFPSLTSLFQTAAIAFHKISLGNGMLLKTPGGEEFKYLTEYFGEVHVSGKPLRGVNAGDQPWSYIIDLLLGVDLKHVFEHAFEGTPSARHYPPEIKTSADVVHYEFQSGEYLHGNYLLPEDYEYLKNVIRKISDFGKPVTSAIPTIFSDGEQLEIAKLLNEITKQYLAASNVHYQLAKRFVPKNSEGEQIGSAGTHIVQFLKEGLNAERERVKNNLELKYTNLLKTNKMEIVNA
jgi:hypothetical protein